MLIALASVVVVVISTYYALEAYIRSDLPRVGKPGLIGYISTAFRAVLDTETLLQEGSDKFAGRPFILPTLGGSTVILGYEDVEILRNSNDTIFNQPIAVNEGLQLDHTLNKRQQRDPYQASVVRTDVTRAIASFIPGVLEETELAMDATFNPSNDSKPISLPVFNTLSHMIGRISNRTMLVPHICRNDDFVKAVVHFAETLIIYAQLLNWLPRLVRPTAYFILSSLFGGQEEPKKFIMPYLKQYMQERETLDEEDRPKNVTELLIRGSGGEPAEGVSVRVLNLNFGSIHTSSIFLTHALFELSVMPESDVESIRTEVREVLYAEGGWNKAAVAKFRKIDSLLKEMGRFYGLGLLGMGRLTIRDGKLSDGTRIPAGYTVAVNLKTVHFNPDIYPHPHVLDPFRFSKLREEEESDVKHGFTTVDRNYLPFGAGRHACPGRFLAAMSLKVFIAKLLLDYDVSLPPGITDKPKHKAINSTVVPAGKAELVFKRRPDAGKI